MKWIDGSGLNDLVRTPLDLLANIRVISSKENEPMRLVLIVSDFLVWTHSPTLKRRCRHHNHQHCNHDAL